MSSSLCQTVDDPFLLAESPQDGVCESPVQRRPGGLASSKGSMSMRTNGRYGGASQPTSPFKDLHQSPGSSRIGTGLPSYAAPTASSRIRAAGKDEMSQSMNHSPSFSFNSTSSLPVMRQSYDPRSKVSSGSGIPLAPHHSSLKKDSSHDLSLKASRLPGSGSLAPTFNSSRTSGVYGGYSTSHAARMSLSNSGASTVSGNLSSARVSSAGSASSMSSARTTRTSGHDMDELGVLPSSIPVRKASTVDTGTNTMIQTPCLSLMTQDSMQTSNTAVRDELAPVRHENEELKTTLNELRNRLDTAEKRARDLESSNMSAQETSDMYKRLIITNVKNMALGEFDKQCSMAELQHLLAGKDHQLRAAVKVIDDLEARKQDLERRLAEEEAVAGQSTLLLNTDTRLEQAVARVAELEQEVARIPEMQEQLVRVAELEKQAATLHKYKVQAIEAELKSDQLKAELNKMSSDLKKVTAQVGTAASREQQMQQDMTALTTTVQQLQQDLKAAAADRDRLIGQLQAVAKDSQEVDAANGATIKTLMAEREDTLSKHQTEIIDLKQHMENERSLLLQSIQDLTDSHTLNLQQQQLAAEEKLQDALKKLQEEHGEAVRKLSADRDVAVSSWEQLQRDQIDHLSQISLLQKQLSDLKDCAEGLIMERQQSLSPTSSMTAPPGALSNTNSRRKRSLSERDAGTEGENPRGVWLDSSMLATLQTAVTDLELQLHCQIRAAVQSGPDGDAKIMSSQDIIQAFTATCSKLSAMHADVVHVKADLADMQQRRDEAEKRLAEAVESMADLQSLKDKAEAESQLLLEQCDKLQVQLKESQQARDDLIVQLEAAGHAVNEHQAITEKLREDLQQLKTEAAVKQESSQEVARKLQVTCEKLQQRCEELERRCGELGGSQEEMTMLRHALAEVQQKLASEESTSQELSRLVSSKMDEVARLTVEKKSFAAEIERLHQTVSEIQEELDAARCGSDAGQDIMSPSRMPLSCNNNALFSPRITGDSDDTMVAGDTYGPATPGGHRHGYSGYGLITSTPKPLPNDATALRAIVQRRDVQMDRLRGDMQQLQDQLQEQASQNKLLQAQVSVNNELRDKLSQLESNQLALAERAHEWDEDGTSDEEAEHPMPQHRKHPLQRVLRMLGNVVLTVGVGAAAATHQLWLPESVAERLPTAARRNRDPFDGHTPKFHAV